MTRGSSVRRMALVAVVVGAGIAVCVVLTLAPASQADELPPLSHDGLTEAQVAPPILATGVEVTAVALQGAQNASGLVVTRSNQGLVAVTVNDEAVSPSHLQYWFEDGRSAGNAVVPTADGVEALALRAGRVTELRRTEDGGLDLVTGPEVETLLTGAHRRALIERLCTEPCEMENEGLAWRRRQWNVVATFSKAGSGPLQRPLSVYWLRFDSPGSMPEAIGPVRYGSGERLREFVAALDITPSGLAIMPGFNFNGVRLVDRRGYVVGEIVLPTARVEGVFWHDRSKRLFLVRECPGSGWRCGGDDPEPIQLWTVTLPPSMLDRWFRPRL